MQAKDIPDDAFLAAVDQAIELRARSRYPVDVASRWDITAVLTGHPEDVVTGSSVDREYQIPEKVVLAKAKTLIRRRLTPNLQLPNVT